ncbi:MAG: helix-turn-helix domain-containing protein [Chloroflexota bacterium]|nr:helix-turn-helix domain-containing protein [Chloroflexota bacterium]
MRLGDYIAGVGHPVAYYPALNPVTGGVTATILLCQLLYLTGKQSDPDGWIYKRQSELQNDTGLSRREQETAREQLRERGLIEEARRGAKGVLHYRVDVDALERQWHEATMSESATSECTKAPFTNGGKRQSLNHTETTAKTTAKSPAGVAPARAGRTQPYPKPEPKRPEPEPPDDFEPDSESREYALAAGCDPNVEKRKLMNHYAKDRVWFRDPQAAFRSWIDKAPRFRQRPQQGSRASPPVKLSAYAVNSARLDALMAGRDPDEAERQARDEAARRLQEVWQ